LRIRLTLRSLATACPPAVALCLCSLPNISLVPPADLCCQAMHYFKLQSRHVDEVHRTVHPTDHPTVHPAALSYYTF